jgi:LacI family transcriptional regulator
MRALMDAGIDVGRDISIIIWGSLADSLVNHRVTTIEQPEQKQAGVKVIEMLLALLDGTSPSELQVLWQPVLMPGSTVGRCPH